MAFSLECQGTQGTNKAEFIFQCCWWIRITREGFIYKCNVLGLLNTYWLKASIQGKKICIFSKFLKWILSSLNIWDPLEMWVDVKMSEVQWCWYDVIITEAQERGEGGVNREVPWKWHLSLILKKGKTKVGMRVTNSVIKGRGAGNRILKCEKPHFLM